MKDFSEKYLNLLRTKLAGLNLTTILDPEEFYQKQILDSINPYLQSKLFQERVSKTGVVVDVGFGGGFPILPLANLLPNIKFIGIESRKKKVDAVKFLAHELGIRNVSLVHSPVEKVLIDVASVITLKAVGSINEYLSKINFSTEGSSIFFYKGPNYYELEGMDKILKQPKSFKFEKAEEIQVPGTNHRFLISFSGQNVPRGTSKCLVKISDFI